MPVKAHVKGKRKAPSPPASQSRHHLHSSIALNVQNSNENSLTINQCGTVFPNNKVGSMPNTMTHRITVHKRKKPAAPLPPCRTTSYSNSFDNVHHRSNAGTANSKEKRTSINDDKMNNLSAISKHRVGSKSPVKAINLNIFEPNHIQNNLHGNLAKETNEVNVNLDTNGKHNSIDMAVDFQKLPPSPASPSSSSSLTSPSSSSQLTNFEQRVWICHFCTLQNPFWKIICDACERIKPYNTPTVTLSNVNRPFGVSTTTAVATTAAAAAATTATINRPNDSAQIDEKILMDSVVRRSKPQKPNHFGGSSGSDDKILMRNSMMVDMKNAIASPTSRAKQMPNKRNSLCLMKYGDQNITPEALELEKERIRALIRAMHNRALAQQCARQNVNGSTSGVERCPEDNRKLDNKPIKTATINRTAKRNSNCFVSKYDNEKDYNLPSIRRNDVDEHVGGGAAAGTAAAVTSNVNNMLVALPRNDELTKWNPRAANAIRKIENDNNNNVNCNELIGKKQTNCDQWSPMNKQSNLKLDDAAAKQQQQQRLLQHYHHQMDDAKKKLGKYSPNANALTSTLANNCVKSGTVNNGISLSLYINFNNAIKVTVPRDMTLDRFKLHIFDQLIPCTTNPKIYFNGLLLKDDDQTLAKYGITNQSALYINTENIVVQAHAKNEKKSVIVQTDETNMRENLPKMKTTTKTVAPATAMASTSTATAAAAAPLAMTASNDKAERRDKATEMSTKTASKSLFDDGYINKNADGEKFLIEHIQLNRYTIERVPSNANINNKVKYRGVYNYNPRCNPDISKILNQKPTNAIKRPTPLPSTVTTNTTINGATAAAAVATATATNTSSTASAASISTATCTKTDINTISNSMVSMLVKNKPLTQYIELLTLDDSMDLTKNTEPFECCVCLVEYQSYDGVMLRNCLHTFCRDCVRNTIMYSDDAEVKCPYIDEKYSCDCLLQDREIKALLTQPEYDEHLAKSLRIAENQIENSFHCKTPDCKGWCIYEDDVNVFKCPICRLENCLTCRVIHDGLNCKQYQMMMKANIDANPENATTHAMLQQMIENGEAMNCPACKIVLMKKWGCDWLKCSMCKTEICWITRGYRWGPAGKGDTSAGCKCGVDGFKCHPKCNYCH